LIEQFSNFPDNFLHIRFLIFKADFDRYNDGTLISKSEYVAGIDGIRQSQEEEISANRIVDDLLIFAVRALTASLCKTTIFKRFRDDFLQNPWN